jgi:hypothetical protein
VHPVPGCEALDHSPCDVRNADCQSQLFALAACLRSEDAGELPPIAVISEQDFAAYLRAWFAERPAPPNPNHYERALVLTGLVVPNAFSSETTVADQVENLGGFYDLETKRVNIIDHARVEGARDFSVVLVHEFVHFLQDRQVDLQRFREENADSYDSFLALDSVIEGEATFHTSRYQASLLGLDPKTIDWTKRFEASLTRSETEILAKPSPYTATRSFFPYDWGVREVHAAWQAQGQTGVIALYASPPQSSRELMLQPGEADDPQFVALDISPPSAGPGWTPWTDNELGAWGTFLLLNRTPQPDVARARQLALGWRGDTLSVYAHEVTSDTALVWRLEFVDTNVALEVANILRGRDKLRVQQQGTRVVVAAATSSAILDWAFAP